MEFHVTVPTRGLIWRATLSAGVAITLTAGVVRAFRPPATPIVLARPAELAVHRSAIDPVKPALPAIANNSVESPAPPKTTPIAPDATDASTSFDAPPDRWFNGRRVRAVRTMEMRVTAYSPDERSCAPFADGFTASGYSVLTNGGRLVAADTHLLPLGTLISVPGYDGGAVVPVLDRGGRIRGHRLDVLYATHERALRWGVKDLTITVWEYADGKPNGFRSQW